MMKAKNVLDGKGRRQAKNTMEDDKESNRKEK